jgi:hypothetical protein
MDDEILALIEVGREQKLQQQEAEEEKLAKKVQEAEESWKDYNRLLLRRLPAILSPYMVIMETPENHRMAPKQLTGYEYVGIEIPELAPIQARVEADGRIYYQLPMIDCWTVSGKPRYFLGRGASDYYGEEQLPVLLYDALQLVEEFDEKMSIYEQQEAEIQAKKAKVEAVDPEYIKVEELQMTADQVLLMDLKHLVREVMREELA